MAYLIGNALGSKDCPRGCWYKTFDYQLAAARVPYPLGWWRTDTAADLEAIFTTQENYGDGGTWQYYTAPVNLPRGKIVEKCYRHYRQDYVNPDGSIPFRTDTIVSQHDGSFDTSGTFDHSDIYPLDLGMWWPKGTPHTLMYEIVSDTETHIVWPNGARIKAYVFLPWTITEARDLAMTLLDNISLLNPAPTYLSDYDNKLFHFGYLSEAAPLGYNTNGYYNDASGYLFITEPFLANVNYTFYRVVNGVPTQIYLPHKGFTTGPSFYREAVAHNGYVVLPGPYDTYDHGDLWVAKCAVRTPETIRYRFDWLLNRQLQTFPMILYNQNESVIPLVTPVTLLPGEHIFLPSDCPDIGASGWAAGLPSGWQPGYMGAGGAGGAGGSGGAGGQTNEF